MTSAPSFVETTVQTFAAAGVDLGALGLAWARVAPAVAIVPAFGLRALPAPARAVLGLALAACIVPAVSPVASDASPTGGDWPLLVLVEVARGLPVAIAAAVPLWAATMAGGVADALRGAQESASSPAVDGPATPMGLVLSLLASAIFLATGGPARVVAALITRPDAAHPLLAAATDLVGGIGLAVALGGPLLAAAVVIEVAGAVVARAAAPAQVQALIAPLRALGTLAVSGIVLERVSVALAHAIQATP
jgi:type III secretory pathway component EscT